MLKRILILALVIITASCKEENKDFLINGTIDSFYSGRKIKLVKIGGENPHTLDSVIITNGKLQLKGHVDSPDMYYIFIDNYKGSLPIIIENTTMDIAFNKDTLDASIVSGSKENDVFKVHQDFAKPLRKQNDLLGNKFRDAKAKNDMATMQAIRKTYDSLVKINTDNSLKNINTYNDAVTSAIFLEDFLKAKVITVKEANELYTNFTDYVKTSRSAKEIKNIISKALATEIGSIAPSFSAPNPEGEIISLNDIKGKVTIIDFWAAWCGPCRRENPNVVKVYNEYHDKGLEIISVSLDGNKRQQNPKEAWINAIAKDNLNWHHVSNLNYFNGEVAKKYNIQSIPATFILDSEGKIVAKNLRGQALGNKIAELLN